MIRMDCMEFFNVSENFEQSNQLCDSVHHVISIDFHCIKGDQLVQSTKEIQKSVKHQTSTCPK